MTEDVLQEVARGALESPREICAMDRGVGASPGKKPRAMKIAATLAALAALWAILAWAGIVPGGELAFGFQLRGEGGIGGSEKSSESEGQGRGIAGRDAMAEPGPTRVVAVVKSSGRQVMLLGLDSASEGVHEVVGPLGVSRFEVRGGRVRMLESPCPEKICINTGWIGQPGEVIACVPNRVVIALRRLP